MHAKREYLSLPAQYKHEHKHKGSILKLHSWSFLQSSLEGSFHILSSPQHVCTPPHSIIVSINNIFSSFPAQSPRFSNKNEGEIIAIRRVLNGTTIQSQNQHTATNSTKDISVFVPTKYLFIEAKILHTFLLSIVDSIGVQGVFNSPPFVKTLPLVKCLVHRILSRNNTSSFVAQNWYLSPSTTTPF